MTFTNVPENLRMQSRQWDSPVFSDAEEVGNRGNQIELKPFFYSVNTSMTPIYCKWVTISSITHEQIYVIHRCEASYLNREQHSSNIEGK